MSCALFCRRTSPRRRLRPARVVCWSSRTQPQTVTVVEADNRGARLVLPFKVRVGEFINACFSDELGLHQSRRARVAWTHRLECAGRLMVGLCFDQELTC